MKPVTSDPARFKSCRRRDLAPAQNDFFRNLLGVAEVSTMLGLTGNRLAWLRRLIVVALLGAAVGITAGFLLREGGMSDLVRGSLTIRTADAEAGPRLTQAEAEAIARKALADHIAGTIAGTVKVSGRAVRLDDLVAVESGFAPAAVEVTSSVSALRYEGGEPENLWVFTYRAVDVPMPDWGITDGVVEASAIVNDTTGKIVSMDALQYNPHGAPSQ